MSFIEFSRLTQLHEGYAATLGRALVISQHVESCAQHVMVVVAVTDEMGDGERDSERLRDFAARLGNVSLGGSMRRLERSGDFGDRMVALEAGRAARNWLVHEAADVVEAAYSTSMVIARIRLLAQQVATIAEADEVLSAASYEICEREPAPWSTRAYRQRVYAWVMAPVLTAVGEMADPQSDFQPQDG